MFPGRLQDHWSGIGEIGELSGEANTSVNASAEVRDRLIEALRLDLIGPRPRDEALHHERLPQAPSRWYLTGFLAPTGAPDAQRAQDAEEELDEPSEPTQGGDDASAPERGSSKRVYLPSSMGLSALADAAAKRLRIALSWGDYTPDEEIAGDAIDVSDEPGGQASAGTARRRFAPWVRRPCAATVDVDLESVPVGTPVPFDVPESTGLGLVCLVRPTRVRGTEGNLDARAISLFVVNRRRPAEDDDVQDTAFAFQVEMTLEADRPFVPRYDPRGLDSDDWDERLGDLHYRDVAEYAVGHNVSVRAETTDGKCRRVQTEWMPHAAVERVEPSHIPGIEFGMEALGSLRDAADAKRSLGPLVSAYRDWIEGQREHAQSFSDRRREVAEELVSRATRTAGRIQAGIDLLEDPELLDAFRIANRAMAAAARRRKAQEDGLAPEATEAPAWRPFQLAYILMNLRGIAEPTHVEREIVDLLFFPPGVARRRPISVWRRSRWSFAGCATPTPCTAASRC